MTINTGIGVGTDEKRKAVRVRTDEVSVLYSYDKLVGYLNYNSGDVYLSREWWKYSPTTKKHLEAWLAESFEEIEQGVKDGRYILADLEE